MTQARITVNTVAGSNDDVPLNAVVQLGNQNAGGELTYLWSIVSQPEGALDNLSAANIVNPFFTPKKEGTYLVELVVNQGLADEQTDTQIVAVRQLATGQRIPAAKETTQLEASGWANATARLLQLVDAIRADNQIVVAWSFAGAVVDQAVKLTGVRTIKTGLPGETTVLQAAAAAGDATPQSIGVIIGPAKIGGPVSDGLVQIRLFGLHDHTQAGDPAVGDPVYADNATSLPTLVAATVRIGTVVSHDAGTHTYRFRVDAGTRAVASPWKAGAGVGSVVLDNGTGNTATGTQSIGAGWNSHATANFAVAIGDGNTASGRDAVALGVGCTASAQSAVAIGDGCQATGVDSVAMGDGCRALGNSSVAMGDGCHAGLDGTKFGPVAIGEGAEADETGSCALNTGWATGKYSLATGYCSKAIREDQFAHASGRFGVNGDAQSSVIEFRGSTPGAAPGEAVELKFGQAGDQTLQLEDGKGYAIVVTAVAKDTVAGGKGVQVFTQRFAARRVAGVTAPIIAGAADQFGDAASATWTLVASVGAAPDRFMLTFTTTGAQAAAKVAAKVEFVEVLNA